MSTANLTLTGTAGADNLVGGDGHDTIYGLGGDDLLGGLGGDDSLDGGSGSDEIWGDDGNDELMGGEGVDWLKGGGGDDYLDGQEGDDELYGDEGGDTLLGGGGDDWLDGGAGLDVAVYHGPLAGRYTVAVHEHAQSYFNVSDTVGGDGMDRLEGTERLQFTDFSVNLTVQSQAAAAPEADVHRMIELYIAFFNRVAEADGLSYWIGERSAGQSVVQIAERFYEAGLLYSDLTGYRADMTDREYVAMVYRNALGRQDAGNTTYEQGLDYWTQQLALYRATNGAQGETRASLVPTILDSAHTFKGDATWGWVADLLDNKIEVSERFAVDWGLNYDTPEESIEQGMAIAAAVTPQDIDAAIALIGIDEGQLVL